MNRESIIKMLKQAGLMADGEWWFTCFNKVEQDVHISYLEAFAKLVAQHERSWEKFCDSNCVWTDHHPDCKLAKDEPVAWAMLHDNGHFIDAIHPNEHARVEGEYITPLYTTPPQRKPLTEKELNVLGTQWHFNLLETKDKAELFAFARAIEAAHGIKGEA
jgi:hypothetical protein